MTDQEINIAIAEACGWEPTPEGHFHPDNPTGQTPPNYTTDLNAMHEAEKVLSPAKCVAYAERLSWFKCMNVEQPIEGPQSFMWGATARQRAEAFLRTLAKWKD